MGDIRAELEAMLREFPAVRIKADGNMIVATCPGENTFEVALEEEFGDITVYFDVWTEEFETGPGCVSEDLHREALRWFLTGLSDTCRLQVFSHRGIDYKWVIEIANRQAAGLGRHDDAFLQGAGILVESIASVPAEHRRPPGGHRAFGPGELTLPQAKEQSASSCQDATRPASWG